MNAPWLPASALCPAGGMSVLHEEPSVPGRADRLCIYHGKLKDGLIAQNGADSRRGVGRDHSPRAPRHHDYHGWFDGQPHTLTWNVDFTPDVTTMMKRIRKAAKRRSLAVSMQAIGGYHGTIAILAARKAAA